LFHGITRHNNVYIDMSRRIVNNAK